jgi:hypothetical protein
MKGSRYSEDIRQTPMPVDLDRLVPRAKAPQRPTVSMMGFTNGAVPNPSASRYGFILPTAPYSSSPDSSRHGSPSPASGERRSPLSRRRPIERSSRSTIACRLFSTRLARPIG